MVALSRWSHYRGGRKAVNKSRNTEHSETSRNIPEHNKYLKLKLNNINKEFKKNKKEKNGLISEYQNIFSGKFGGGGVLDIVIKIQFMQLTTMTGGSPF